LIADDWSVAAGGRWVWIVDWPRGAVRAVRQAKSTIRTPESTTPVAWVACHARGHYNGRVAPPLSGLIDLVGFLTGVVLYVMLVAMVWRERAVEGTSFLSRRGRLPLLTGVCGLIWNLGALASFGLQIAGTGPHAPPILAIAFAALGFLPAVVVHSLLEGREVTAVRSFVRPAIGLAYALSVSAGVLHLVATWQGHAVPSPSALWLLTIGFTALTASLLFMTREQPIGRRGIWVAALSIFAVSALHFGRHVGNESWWVELIGHHASLALALAILLQDYRFALADLFLKNAIALLSLMAVALGVLSVAVLPLVRWQGAAGVWDPRVVALLIVLWIGTAMLFPALRRLAAWLVDRAVLRRPDYGEALAGLVVDLESVEREDVVVATAARTVGDALGTSDVRLVADPCADDHRGLVMAGPELRANVDVACTAILRLRTVEPPHPALAIGRLAAGRRLLSDDVRWLESVARVTARRIDSLRVARERLARNLREEAMQRMTTEAELRALRAQLHPHFLFNALTAIAYLIQHAPARALDTLVKLTSVLRGVLRRSTAEFSTLGEELDFITSYLDIERARFEERLAVAVDVPPDIRDVLLPTLVLQPLVENAIKHGIAPQRAGGAVRISGHAEDGRLDVRIADSGRGFDTTQVPDPAGLGLRSVRDRLRAHYGDAGICHIDSRVGGGTTVTLSLPAYRAGAHARTRRAG
jgi:two-component system, LytTR family, sensor kinase